MKKYLLIALLAFMLLVVGCAKEMAEEPAPVVAEEPATTEPAAVTETVTETEMVEEVAEDGFVVTGDVEMLGKGGINPTNLKVKVGDAVTFVNKNPDKSKVTVLVIENKETGQDVASEKVLSGEGYTHVFEEAGTYRFWDVGYGVFGEIVVE